MRRKFVSVVLIFIALSIGRASQEGSVFNENAAWKHVKILSDSFMEGREAGQQGARRAEDYVAGQFKEWGIEPAGDRGTYFQDVTFNSFRIKGKARLEIILDKERRDFLYQNDWRILPQSGTCQGIFEIVFAGYGISAPQKEYDDYQGLNVLGRMVLISDKVPQSLAAKTGKQASLENRIAAAREHGAKGIVFFNNSFIVRQYMDLNTKPSLHKEDFALLAVEDGIVDFMFKNMKKEGSLSLKEIEGTLRPSSYELKCRMFLSVSTGADPKAVSRNVIGRIPGEDNNLKNEYIVISAHLDHVGINPVGEIMHGANDNASGAAVVLETARCMKAGGIKPKRTVIFALWTGEELGLVGSKYYNKHPLFPLERTIININLDMVGQGKGKIKVYGSSYFPEIWEYLVGMLPEKTKESIIPIGYSPGGSDHTSFLDKGIPAFLVQSEGPHFKIHRSQDRIEYIDLEALKTAGEFVLGAVKVLGYNSPDFIFPLRYELTQLKHQVCIDYRCPSMDEVLRKNPNPEDSIMDLKLAIISGDGDLSGDALGLNILGKMLKASKSIMESDSLSLYSSINNLLTSDMGPRKMILLAGVQGTEWMTGDQPWGLYLRRNGLAFVTESGRSVLFQEKGMTKAGNDRIQKLLGQGLVVIMHGLTQPQAAGALKETSYPLIIADKNMPGDEILNLVPLSHSAIGLIYEDGEDPSSFMKKIEYMKDKIGTEHIIIFSRCSSEKEEGKKALLDLMSLLLASEYKGKDVYNLFSGTFTRILCRIDGEEEPPVYSPMPF